MGYQKFYETPAGKLRAGAILASGIQYSFNSIEFKLSLLHYVYEVEYKRRHDIWIANRLQGIFFAVAIGKLTEESRTKIIKEAEQTKTELYNMLDVFKSVTAQNTKAEQEKIAEADRHKAAYAEVLTKNGGFTDIDNLLQTMRDLNQAIQETKKVD